VSSRQWGIWQGIGLKATVAGYSTSDALEYHFDVKLRTSMGTPKLVGIGLCIMCLVIALYPVRRLAASKWDVWVVTDAGLPLLGVNVRLSYENYSTESDSHEMTSVTDTGGHVLFPANSDRRTSSRELSTPLVRR
jgi:hypothetical protein